MAIQDRNVSRKASIGRELVVMASNVDAGQTALVASTTRHAAAVVPFDCYIAAVGLDISAKANTDNTVTLTFLKNGSAFVPALTIAILSGSGTAAQTKETDAGEPGYALVAGDRITVDTGAFGGTTPSFSKPVIYLVLRKAGPDRSIKAAV